VIRAIGDRINKDALTANGRTIWENCADAPNYNEEVIRPLDNPLTANGGIAVLRGNLAPSGAVIKPSAATPELMRHRGRAVVFENVEDYKARIDDPDLDIDETCVMVMKNCGPRGYPGMAEVGNMGLPSKVLRKVLKDSRRNQPITRRGTPGIHKYSGEKKWKRQTAFGKSKKKRCQGA
jgi:L-arabonate dehydrase